MASDPTDTDQSFWKKEIDKAKKRFKKEYFDRCNKIEQRYLSEENNQAQLVAKTKRKFNMLWTNQEILRPATFSQLPEAACVRRHKTDDQLSNAAAEILTNALDYNSQMADVVTCCEAVRDDYLLYGRGVPWAMYEIDESDEHSPFECVRWLHVPREHFLHSAGRRWDDVWWCARKIEKDRAWIEEKYPQIKGKLDTMDDDDATKEREDFEIWQIWSKRHKQVFMFCDRAEDILEVTEPPYSIDGFFPCPRPAFGTLPDDKLIPTPDYVFYQDDSDDIDAMMSRIAALIEALKTRGVYDERFMQLRDLFNQPENAMVPIKDYDEFAQRGGIKGSIEFFPTDQIIKTIEQLELQIGKKVDIIYQKTGIADIMRSLSDPSETLGAQQLKSNYGHIRLQTKRREIARIICDMLRITAEIICELFSDESIELASGVMLVDAPAPVMLQPGQAPPQREPLAFPRMYRDDFMRAVQLLRTEWLRKYRIDVETETTVAPDEAQQQQRASDMLGNIGTYMQQAVAVGQQVPELVPVMAEAIKMVTRTFRTAAPLEPVLDAALQKLVNKSQQPPAQKPDAVQVAAMDQQRRAMRDQAEIHIKTEQLRMDQEGHAADMAIKQKELEQKDQELMLEAEQEKRLAARELLNVKAQTAI